MYHSTLGLRVIKKKVRVPCHPTRRSTTRSSEVTKFTLGRCVVQIWSRTTPKTTPKETRAAHRVEPLEGEQIVSFNRFDVPRKSPESGERQHKSRAWNRRFGPAPRAGGSKQSQCQRCPTPASPHVCANRLPHWSRYIGTSPIKNTPPPQGHHRALDIVIL